MRSDMSNQPAGPSIRSRADFERALHLGLGRVVLFLRDHSDEPFRDLIRHACWHLTAYDPQFEGTRAQYYYDVICATRDADYYRNEVAAALKQSGDDYDASLRFDLAARFAAAGDAEMRQLMYEKFDANCASGDDLGATAIIELDKADGMRYVAAKEGELYVAGNDTRYDEYLLSVAEDVGVTDPIGLLKTLAPTNAGIAAYVARVEATALQRQQAQANRVWAEAVTLEEFVGALDVMSRKRLPVSPVFWGKSASDADLLHIAQMLLAEQNPRRLRALLRVFHLRAYPLDPSIIVGLVSHHDQFVAVAALRALEQIERREVRELALRLMEGDDYMAARAVRVLAKNHAASDHRRVEDLTARLSDPDALHSLGFCATDFYAAHPEPASQARVMLALYERNPCSGCRDSSVEQLLALDAIPEWMRAECAFDSNLEVRKLVADNGAA
jgi:hypothetical protein